MQFMMRFIKCLCQDELGRIEDVLIDSIGVVLGICILLFFVKLYKNKIERKLKNA